MASGEARLAAELTLYAVHKAEWLKQYSGQYVVAKGDTILGFHPTFEVAYRAGVREWGVRADFLVKQIVEHEAVFFVF
jgi:hypothetical protein